MSLHAQRACIRQLLSTSPLLHPAANQPHFLIPLLCSPHTTSQTKPLPALCPERTDQPQECKIIGRYRCQSYAPTSSCKFLPILAQPQECGLWRYAANLIAHCLTGPERAVGLSRWATHVIEAEGSVWRGVGLLTAAGCLRSALQVGEGCSAHAQRLDSKIKKNAISCYLYIYTENPISCYLCIYIHSVRIRYIYAVYVQRKQLTTDAAPVLP